MGFALCVGLGYAGASAVKSGATRGDLLSVAAELVSRAQAAVPLPGRRQPPVATVANAPASESASTPTLSIVGASAIAPPWTAGVPATTAQELPLTVPTNGDSSAVADSAGAASTDAPGTPPMTQLATPGPTAPSVATAPTTPAATTPAGTSAATKPAAPPAKPRYTPRLAQGRTDLGSDGLYAVREGDLVRVHFDTDLGRTRRPAKFEQIVRATLPAIFGAAGDSLLRQVPGGRIASSGDLIVELPERGVELRHIDGRAVKVWPETRSGRDGPIVVSYRVKPTP